MNRKERREFINKYHSKLEATETYKERILDTFDLEELCDVLNINPSEILNRFEDKVTEYAEAEGWTQTDEDGPEDSQERDEAYS